MLHTTALRRLPRGPQREDCLEEKRDGALKASGWRQRDAGQTVLCPSPQPHASCAPHPRAAWLCPRPHGLPPEVACLALNLGAYLTSWLICRSRRCRRSSSCSMGLSSGNSYGALRSSLSARERLNSSWWEGRKGQCGLAIRVWGWGEGTGAGGTWYRLGDQGTAKREVKGQVRWRRGEGSKD